MKRMSVSLCLSFILFFSILGMNNTIQAEGRKNENKSASHHNGHFMYDKELIYEQAKELGISTENKDTHVIVKEIFEKRILKKAESLQIDTKGKDLDVIAKEVKEVMLKKQADELGIATDNKDLKQLHKEVRIAQINKLAKELNIATKDRKSEDVAAEIHDKLVLQSAEKLKLDTKGKTTKELLSEIVMEHRKEAKDQKLFPFNKNAVHFFNPSKGAFYKLLQ